MSITKLEIKEINECIKRIQQMDWEAVDTLYELMKGTPYFIALRYLKNDYDAKDLVQEFWYEIYNIVSKMKFVNNGFKYLCKTIENMAKMQLRKTKRERVYDGLIIDVPEDNIDKKDSFLLLEQGFGQLTKEEYLVISLIYFENKTIREVAKELNRSKSDVDRIKSKALIKLKLFCEEESIGKS